MKVLLVYPKSPDSFWSFSYALKFISKKSSFPPLGLITVSALLPDDWEKKLIDMNVEKLHDKHLKWADYVCISAMAIQKDSVKQIITRCKALGVKTVLGGPLVTCDPDAFEDVDHRLLYEGEITIPQFVRDVKKGCAKPLYTTNETPDISASPCPDWDLVNLKKYATCNLQYSRGCPYQCDFCNVTTLFGHVPRTKSSSQIIAELECLYQKGWRREIFFVDDNFIGNRKKLKEEILPALIDWMEKRKYPFSFMTEASINLADDDELIDLMVKAGFNNVFIGIETVNQDSLVECNKFQNRDRDLLACVQKLQKAGLRVDGGFIIGFDHDTESIFDRMAQFIQDTGIVTAMVGLLSAPKGTKLYERLEKEGRVTPAFSGNNTDFSTNILPKMNWDTLIDGYKHILQKIYSPKHYYERVMRFLQEYRPVQHGWKTIRISDILAFFTANVRLGIIGKERLHYWKLIFWSIIKCPKSFPMAVRLAIFGFHFRKIFSAVM